MGLKILLADPEFQWLEKVKQFFESNLYEVDYVDNGRDAQNNIANNKYFCVFLAHNLKNHTGTQVLRFIQANKTGLKVIISFPDQEYLEKNEVSLEDLRKMGVKDFVTKPVENETLKNLLEEQQDYSDYVEVLPTREGVSEEKEYQYFDTNFTSIKIDEFYTMKAVLFDIYIRLGQNRYVKILHAGDTFARDRLDKYKNNKKVTHLYFFKSDRKKYIVATNAVAQKVIPHKKVDGKVKINMLKNMGDKLLEEISTEGLRPQTIEQSKEVCSNVYSLIDQHDDLYKTLRDYQDFDPNAFSHAFLVTLFSSAIIKQFEWQSKTTVETIAMACMFHDIGKLKLPKELIDLRPDTMNDEQKVEYQKHPFLGMEILEGKHSITNAVKQIIYQHHETFNGSGFPLKLKGNKILTLANVVCLANDFAHVIIDHKVKPVDGVKIILQDYENLTKYNSQIVKNFINVFVNPEILAMQEKLATNSRIITPG